MRNAHIITKDGKLIGPGPADKIRAEAAKLDDGTLYIDGRHPRKIGSKSQDSILELIAKEREEMVKKQNSKRAAEEAASKKPNQPNPETAEEHKARAEKEKAEAEKAIEIATAEANKQLNKKSK